MSGRSEPEACPCRWCDEKYTAAGIERHEQYCDENPTPGITYEQQVELGLLGDGKGGTTDTGTNPHQEAEVGDGGLPPRSSVEASNKVSQTVRADGSDESSECPACGGENTLDSSDARSEYEQQEENPAAGVVLAFNLSERYCEDCFTLWGDEFREPVGLSEAVGAAGGGA